MELKDLLNPMKDQLMQITTLMLQIDVALGLVNNKNPKLKELTTNIVSNLIDLAKELESEKK